MKPVLDFKKLIKLISPQPAINGLNISETGLQFIGLQDGFKKASVSLEPGVILDGKLRDGKKFLEALMKLRQLLGLPKAEEKIYAIISIPPHNIYTQSFSLPPIPKEKLVQEAAMLNLQLISPIDIKNAYYDSERINGPEKEDEKIELLGAFVNKVIIDDFVSVLSQAGFRAVAIEFPALSIARVIKETAVGLNLEKPQIALVISSEGLNFLILKNGRLRFHYFSSWGAVQGRQISTEMFNGIIIQEIKKIVTFYSSHWNDQINDLVLITQGMGEEIKKLIQMNFSSLNVQILNLNEQYSKISPLWYTATGCFLRGLIPRSQDFLISLMAVGTEERFLEEQILSFIKVWRIVLASSLGFLVIVFLLSDGLLMNISSGLAKQLTTVSARGDSAEIAQIELKVQEFNTLAKKALAAKTKKSKHSQFFETLGNIGNTSGGTISLQNISFAESTGTVSLSARASSQTASINFKNKLSELKDVKNLNLPLSDMITNPDGSVSFSLTFIYSPTP
ncbi:MAG: hypothetical protein PHP03_01155 [Candidatus Pacebacteria bacterium]|nr:hypothetical protein [Candidatus Paceibacterota bacterium]